MDVIFFSVLCIFIFVKNFDGSDNETKNKRNTYTTNYIFFLS